MGLLETDGMVEKGTGACQACINLIYAQIGQERRFWDCERDRHYAE